MSFCHDASGLRLPDAQAGVDCHFVKPVSVRDLVLALDERATPGVTGSPQAS